MVEKEIPICWLNCQRFMIKAGTNFEELKTNIEFVTGIPRDLQRMHITKMMLKTKNETDFKKVLALSDDSQPLKICCADLLFAEYNNLPIERLQDNGLVLPIESFLDNGLAAPAERFPDIDLANSDEIPQAPDEQPFKIKAIYNSSEMHLDKVPSQNVESIKSEIAQIFNIQNYLPSLYHQGRLLRNKEKLKVIQNSPIISVINRIPEELTSIEKEQMQIKLEVSYENQKFEFTESKTSNIEMLKQKISSSENIPVEMQSLYYEGRMLRNSEILEFFNRSPVFKLIVRDLGGGKYLDTKTNTISEIRNEKEAKQMIRLNKGLTQVTECLNENCGATQSAFLEDEGIFIGENPIKCTGCGGFNTKIKIFMYMVTWKFFGIKNGNRIILNKRHADSKESVSWICEENKQLHDMSSFSEFRFEIQPLKKS